MKSFFVLILVISCTALSGQLQTYLVNNTDLETSDEFGQAVAISDEFMAVSAHKHNNKAGAVFIYKINGSKWVLHQKLTPPASSENEYFGSALAINDRYLVVGAPGPFNTGVTGRVFVYRLKNDKWSKSGLLQPSDDFINSWFGRIVNLHENKILVSAPSYDVIKGAVVLYENFDNRWTQTQQFINTEIFTSSYGASIDLNDDWIAIERRVISSNEGFATGDGAFREIFLYQKLNDNWIEKQNIKFTPQITTHTTPSNSVELSKDQLIIGNYGHNRPTNIDGEIRIYHLDGSTWVENQQIIPPGFSSNEIGRRTAIGKDFAMITALNYPKEDFDNPYHVLIYDTSNRDHWNLIADFAFESSPSLFNSGFSVDISNSFAAAAIRHSSNLHGDVNIYDLRNAIITRNLVEEIEVKVFPVPSSDNLFVEVHDQKLNSIIVFDPIGKVVFTDSNLSQDNYNLNITSLQEGNYWMKIITNEGHLYKKFIKF